jgi:glutamine synthetase
MAKTQILPACLRFQGEMARAYAELRAALNPAGLVNRVQDAIKGDGHDDLIDVQFSHLQALVSDVSQLVHKTNELEDVLHGLHETEGLETHARYCIERIVPAMMAVREVTDRLEGQVDAKHWPMPTYLDLLFHL